MRSMKMNKEILLDIIEDLRSDEAQSMFSESTNKKYNACIEKLSSVAEYDENLALAIEDDISELVASVDDEGLRTGFIAAIRLVRTLNKM